MAFQMAIIILAGTLGGKKLDQVVHWNFPVFTVLLSFLSVLAAIYIMIKELITKDKNVE